MIMFTYAATAASLLVVLVTTIGCVSQDFTFGVAAVLGVTIGLGAGLWARRAA